MLTPSTSKAISDCIEHCQIVLEVFQLGGFEVDLQACKDDAEAIELDEIDSQLLHFFDALAKAKDPSAFGLSNCAFNLLKELY